MRRSMLLFVALSMADVGLTAVLMGRYGVPEANPVAAHFYARHGVLGLALIKGAGVGGFLGVLPHCLHRARILLRGANTVVATIVAYSILLLGLYANAELLGLKRTATAGVATHRAVVQWTTADWAGDKSTD